MKYVCSWSGGKDSTATIILAHEHGDPLDLILMAEVMFDKKRGISGENPEHMKWVREYAIPLFAKWGYKTEIVHGKIDYLDDFYTVTQHSKKHTWKNGKEIYGFLVAGRCHLNWFGKRKAIKDRLASEGEINKYVGIAIDEPIRLARMHNDTSSISLLEKYGYTEKMAMELCRKYGLVSPVYQYVHRGGVGFVQIAQ